MFVSKIRPKGLSNNFKNLAEKCRLDYHVFQPAKINSEKKLVPDVYKLWKKAPEGLSIFQSCEEQKATERKRGLIRLQFSDYVNKLKPENRSKPTSNHLLRNQRPNNHLRCQVCNVDMPDYFKHIATREHRNKWKTPSNKDHYSKVDELLAEISVDHFKMIDTKQLENDKENLSINQEGQFTSFSSKVTQSRDRESGVLIAISTNANSNEISMMPES